jgi:hypothetical protein
LNKITVGKYKGYAEFTPRRAGIFVFFVEKYLKVARVYKVKSGEKKDEVRIQQHPHGVVERKIHRTNEWIPLPPDLILPLIKILQKWYVELNEEEVPETVAFEKVSEDKELSEDIKKIGL